MAAAAVAGGAAAATSAALAFIEVEQRRGDSWQTVQLHFGRDVTPEAVVAVLDSEQAERGVFPRVLFLTTTAARRAVLLEVCSRLPAEAWALFTVALLDSAVDVMSGQIANDAHELTGEVAS